MKIETIMKRLEQEYPKSQAMEWDNPGLQVGRPDHPLKKVFVALDATNETIRQCIEWKADLLLTHHPLLMTGLRQVNDSSLIGQKVLDMAENGIAHYAIHTNYDVTTMGELARNALGLRQTAVLETTGTAPDGSACGIGCVGELSGKMTAAECCGVVRNAFNLPNVRLFGDKNAAVHRIAVSPGSGKSMIAPALASGVDLLITGDIGHHDGIDAVDQGLLIIDAGHYGVEHVFIHQMAEFLHDNFPELTIKEAAISQPFEVL